jgi:hypothetical protein
MNKSNKTIKITLRFFTNDLPEKIQDKITPCWPGGFVYLEANERFGLKPVDMKFNSVEELPKIIRAIMKKAKIMTLN